MAAGADKAILYDPPGAIGLFDRDRVLLLRFDETTAPIRPQDVDRVCNDFDTNLGTAVVMPDLVPGILGRARVFDGATTGLAARDKVSGATLRTRDLSIQVVATWNAALQLVSGVPGTLVSRGLGTSSAEYVAYGLRLDVVDAPTHTASIRWYWQDIAGADHVQTGVSVVLPPGQWTMLTATRRWASPTQVVLRYYVGDQLLGEVTSANGSIGGGTTGAMQIGYRTSGGVNGKWLAGSIDELLIVDRELCAEEVEATWLRLTRYQPLGVRLFTEMFDDGFPLNTDPSSDQALDVRMTGQALGFCAAQFENIRNNFLPIRAYGSVLADWEQAVRVTPAPSSSIDERRARVIARLAQRLGCSIPGVLAALLELVDCDPADLEIIAFDNTWQDEFTTLSTLRWDLTPTACCTAVAGAAHFAPGAGNFTALDSWLTIASVVSRRSEFATYSEEHALAQLTMTTPQNACDAGVWFGNRITSDYLLLGLRDVAGTFKVVSESFIAGVSQGAVVQATLGANPAAIWLHLYQDPGTTTWRAAWSTASRTAGYAFSAPIVHSGLVHWSGCYFRSTGAMGAAVVDFKDFTLRTPRGSRPNVVYVFRDPALGGHPDIEGAESVIQQIKHAFVNAHIIESKVLRAGVDPGGRTPMGAL